MNKKIISLRGTSGSGKSTVVHQLLGHAKYHPLVVDFDAKDRPMNYQVMLGARNTVPLYIIGRYTSPCGGCDTIQNYTDELMERIPRFHELGHVLFEGLLVSGGYGRLGIWSQRYEDDFIFAYLDTPLETCLKRIQQRRTARGDERPLNPKNTTTKFNGIASSRRKIEDEYGRKVVNIHHKHALEDVLRLLKVKP